MIEMSKKAWYSFTDGKHLAHFEETDGEVTFANVVEFPSIKAADWAIYQFLDDYQDYIDPSLE